MSEYPDDAVLQAIAAENNLAETAFLLVTAGELRSRWFTPVLEVPLCGHATLASAAVVMERLQPTRLTAVFETKSGPLPVRKEGDGYLMDFPSRPSEEIPTPMDVAAALGVELQATFKNSFNFMAVLDSPRAVRECQPDLGKVARLDRPGVIVTALGDGGFDFVSRYFAPQKGIPEDPVTGAAHCMLAPYWAKVLGKHELLGFQASKRGGEVRCKLGDGRVELQGRCVFVIEGQMTI
jgi:PhzF family phenazine biosynthesis protein